MFSLNNHQELRKVTILSLITCIYLPSIVTVISYKDLLYTVGKSSSIYILVLIFISESIKSLYLNFSYDIQTKKSKHNKNRVNDFFRALVFLVGVAFCFFVGIILFGAQVLDKTEETLMLSCLLMLLAAFPLIAHTGVEAGMQLLFGVKTFARDTVVATLVNNAVLTICGAWLGAIVIPLDWNKPWQEWPIPCYLGAIGGYLISNVLAVLKVTMMSAANKYPIFKVVVNLINKLHFSK